MNEYIQDSYAQLYPILSPLVNGSAYPDHIQETASGKPIAPPHIIYREISAVADNAGVEFLEAEYIRVQIDVYHKSHLDCRLLSNQVISAVLAGIRHCEYVSRQRLYDPDTMLARYSMDFQFLNNV